MVTIKKKEEIELLREGGRRLAAILQTVKAAAQPGTTAEALNDLAHRLIVEGGDTPSFLGYRGKREKRPFPSTLCVSVNDEIVHGVSNEKEKTLREGDVVGLDVGLCHRNLFVDTAVTVGIVRVTREATRLLRVTREALMRGIAAARAGNTVGDISATIEEYVRPFGFGIIHDLGGHGVGYSVHEEPLIPNYGMPGTGEVLKAGMVLAIEPMLSAGSPELLLAPDGFTYRIKDGSIGAHFEHTIVVTAGKPEILTVP